MRILHVMHQVYHEPCGYRTRSRYVLEHQQRLGLDVAVVTSAAVGEFEAEISPDPWPVVSAPPYQGPRAPLVREVGLMRTLERTVTAAIARFAPDIVHAHSPVLVSSPALAAARRAGIPLVYELRDLWENASVDHGKFSATSPQYRLARAFDSRVMRRAAALVTISESLRADILGRGIVTPVTVVANGVDTAHFVSADPGLENAKAAFGLDRRAVLAYIGTFQPYEGLETLLHAVRNVATSVPSLHVLIVGHGPQDRQLRDLATRLDLSDRVTFTGRLPHERVRGAYAAADVLVYPRLSTRTTELTTPLKPLEAMAMGKCVVVSDVGALRELVQPDVTGLTFKAGDARDLARVCATALEDAALRARLGLAAETWVRRERRWEDVVSRYLPVYGQVAGRQQ